MKTNWREKIDGLEPGGSVRIHYTSKDQTLRKYVSSVISKVNKATYSVHKVKNEVHTYLITRNT